MKRRIDSAEGKRMIAARFAAVESVFGNLRDNKWLTRFMLDGRGKVLGQCKCYCMVHNLEKPAMAGRASSIRKRVFLQRRQPARPHEL